MPGAPGPVLWPDCGTLTAYQRHNKTGQRHCERCRARSRARWAHYARQRALAGGPRRISAVGSQRRIQALHVIGWTAEELGARLTPPVSSSAIQMTLTRPMIFRDRAMQIAALYEQLWDTPGPSALRRTRALANGWLPPMAWDDDEIDNPDHVPLEIVLRDWALALEMNRKRKNNRQSYAVTTREHLTGKRAA